MRFLVTVFNVFSLVFRDEAASLLQHFENTEKPLFSLPNSMQKQALSILFVQGGEFPSTNKEFSLSKKHSNV